MSVLDKIHALRDKFPRAEQQLAEYILANPDHIRDMPSQMLAKAVGISQASVVRFTQKLGYKGYPDFKFAITDSLHHQVLPASADKLHGEISLDDTFSTMSQKLLASKINVLNKTHTINSQTCYEQAALMLRNAKRVLLCGKGGSALVAKDFSYKLQKLGMAALAETDTHVQLANIANYTADDVLVVLSESGETPDSVKITEQAASNSVQIISITAYGANSIARLAGLNLYTVADESSARLSSILARNAQELVIDTLFILLTQTCPQGRKKLAASNKAVDTFLARKR
ncbi:MurR/RpiR family transcriptional regulator [Rheinheimera hassiensis]|uniref:MurR/RpiR family transcriptional regulator n=1 Tax=Rheinheimera hassiensis TaxID=1193627 RepID=UPI001F055CF7|nr:MurR/RpiR family transcriptional regulator [Rheinheimera hassiensis]